MAGLKFSDIAAKLPAGSITDDGAGNITISVNAVTGKASLSEADEGLVADFLSDFGEAGRAAQTEFNTNNNTSIGTFGNPTRSAPALASDGKYYSTKNQTISTRTPTDESMTVDAS